MKCLQNVALFALLLICLQFSVQAFPGFRDDVRLVRRDETGLAAESQQDEDVQKPAVQEPIVQEPVKQEPIKQTPVKQEPVKQEPVKQEPVKQEVNFDC